MRLRSRTALIIAHFISSYLAGAAFIGVDVYVYRPIHFSDPETRRGATYLFAASPLTAPLILVGYPTGAAIHHYFPRPIWCFAACLYAMAESAIIRAWCKQRRFQMERAY